MAHEKVYGFCENKCKVEVAPKTETDAMKEKLNAINITNDGVLQADISGYLYLTGDYTEIEEEGDFLAWTCEAQSDSSQNTRDGYSVGVTLTVNDYVSNLSFPLKISPGVYIKSLDYIRGTHPVATSRTASFSITGNNANSSSNKVADIYVNNVKVKTISCGTTISESASHSVTVKAGDVLSISSIGNNRKVTISVSAAPNVYIIAS